VIFCGNSPQKGGLVYQKGGRSEGKRGSRQMYDTKGPYTTSQRTSTAFLAEKKISIFFPATTEQNIARVNLFREPSVSFYLMAIVAIIAIHQECIFPVALFNWGVVTY
jgi:hypothetical protein